MNVKSLFNTTKGEINQVLNAYLLKGIGEIEDIVADYTLTEAQMQAALTAKQIEYLLNQNERSFPRKDPALKGLDTAKWKVFAYVNYVNVQKRLSNGQFDFKFRFVAINLQKPFRYRFDFTNYRDRYGKLLLNTPVSSLTNKERKQLLKGNKFAQLPEGYVSKEIKALPVISWEKYHNKDPKGGKVGSRRAQTVGNLAAIRLAIKSGIVKPKNAKKIVFWVGNAKRLNKQGKALRGNRIGVHGYVFVDQRQYNIGGHDRYKQAVNNIIESEVNRFMDTLW